MSAKLEMVGSWRKEMNVTLSDALSYTYELCGRSLAEACKHAIIMMAKAASARTKQSPKLRRVVRNPDKRWKTDARVAPFGVMKYKKGKEVFVPIYRAGEFGKFRFFDKRSMHWMEKVAGSNVWRSIASGPDAANPELIVPGIMTDKRRVIRRSGLAKKSWRWGLKDLNVPTDTRGEISGVSAVRKILTKTMGGFVMTNKLKYILAAMKSPGWKSEVEQSAANKIMKQAQLKLEGKWAREVARARNQGRPEPNLAQYISKVS